MHRNLLPGSGICLPAKRLTSADSVEGRFWSSKRCRGTSCSSHRSRLLETASASSGLIACLLQLQMKSETPKLSAWYLGMLPIVILITTVGKLSSCCDWTTELVTKGSSLTSKTKCRRQTNPLTSLAATFQTFKQHAHLHLLQSGAPAFHTAGTLFAACY